MTQAAHNYPVESDMTSKRIKTLEFYISYFRDVVQSIMGKLHSRKPVDFCFFLQQCNRKKNTKQRRSVCGWNQCDTKYFNDELTCVFVYNKCRSKQKHFPLCKLLLKTTQTLILYFALLIFFFSVLPKFCTGNFLTPLSLLREQHLPGWAMHLRASAGYAIH